MARIRTIKPDFFTSEDIVALSPLARLLYIALWCECDREGRLTWRPKTFKLRYLPHDDCDIEQLCVELLSRHLVVRYGDGGHHAYVPTFLEHQHVNPREQASNLPVPPVDKSTSHEASVTSADASNPDLHVQVGRERKGKEGKEVPADTRSLIHSVAERLKSTNRKVG